MYKFYKTKILNYKSTKLLKSPFEEDFYVAKILQCIIQKILNYNIEREKMLIKQIVKVQVVKRNYLRTGQ